MEKSASALFPFPCADCGWSYETRDKLQQHVQQNHMIEYICSQPADQADGELGEQRLRLHIKRSFVSAFIRPADEQAPASSDAKEGRASAVCKKCNISFISKVLFERHLKGHVHESEVAVKVRRIQIPSDVLRDVSNSFANRAASAFDQNQEVTDFCTDNAVTITDVSGVPPVPVTTVQSGSSSSMESPKSSEQLSRSYLDELSGFITDVTESILTTPQKGTDSGIDMNMTAAEAPQLPKTTHLPPALVNGSGSDGFRPSPTRDFSQPPTFPRVCSSPTEGNHRPSPFSTPSPRNNAAGPPGNLPNSSRLSEILQMPNGPTQTQVGQGFPPSTTSSCQYGGPVRASNTSACFGNSISSSAAIGMHCSGGTQLISSAFLTAGASTMTRPSNQAISTGPSVVSMHGNPAGSGSRQTMTTMAPSQTGERLNAMLSGGQTMSQHGQPSNLIGQAMQRSIATTSPGVRRTPPASSIAAANNPLALLNQMNMSVSRGRPQEANIQERPASVIVLENPQENPVPSIHSVVSLQPGYKHETWGNIVVPATADGASQQQQQQQHIHQNPNSPCQCLPCRDIRGGDLLRKSQQTEKGRCEYKCPSCKRLFTQKTSFIRHCKSFRHAFVCDMCHCGFLTEAPYETHKSLHLMKGLLHSGPPPQPSSASRPQSLGSHQMPAPRQKLAQGLPVMGISPTAVLAQHQQHIGQPRINPSQPKPVADDADDDVVVLESGPSYGTPAQPRKPLVQQKNQFKRISPAMPQQQRGAVPIAPQGGRPSLVPQRSVGIMPPPQQQQQQQQLKSQITMQPLSATPPQISRILNNSELTLTPIARVQEPVPSPATSVADVVLRSNPNVQLTDNGPQKPVQINVSSSVLGLAPMTAAATAAAMRRPLPNILAKRPQAVSANSSPQASGTLQRPMNATFQTPQSQQQQSNVFRVLPNAVAPVAVAAARPGMKANNNMQMNAVPMWHHPVPPSGVHPPMPGRPVNQRPQTLPSSHQSHGPNRYPPVHGQPQNGSARYVSPMRLPPPPPYSQATYSRTRPQARPQALNQMGGMLPEVQAPKERLVKCRICGGIFASVSLLQEHFKQTHAQAMQQHQPQQQPQQQQGTLGMQHAQNVQPGTSTLLYQQLNMHNPQQPNLQQVQQSPHHPMQQLTQQASYPCRRCQKGFQSLPLLQAHEAACGDNVLVSCISCNQMVFKNEVLAHYSKFHHNGNPPSSFNNGSQADGTPPNRISPNNPAFHPRTVHPGNSAAVNVMTPLVTTSDTIPLTEFARDATAESSIAIAGFNLNEASDTLVKQMSIATEPLLPPPPLVKLSSVGAIQKESVPPELQTETFDNTAVRSMLSLDDQHFTNAGPSEEGTPYLIIQSVHSLSEAEVPDMECGTAYEKPLSPVVVLVAELVNTVEEECDKDSLLDEASGLFVKQNQDAPVFEAEAEVSAANGPVDATQAVTVSSDQSVKPMDTDSAGREDSAAAIGQSDDSAWLIEPLSEDSCDTPPPTHESAVSETDAAGDVGAGTPPTDEVASEVRTLEQSSVLRTDSESGKNAEALDATEQGNSSEDVTDMTGSEQEDVVQEGSKKSTEDMSAVVVLLQTSESEESATDNPTAEPEDANAGEMEVDSRSESDKINGQNDSDTDTVALEDDGETSETTTAVATSEEKPPACPICDLEFDSRKDLVEHSRIHLNSEHCCTFCSGTFSSKSLLRNHLRTHLRSCREPPRNSSRKRHRPERDFLAPGAPENMAIALFDYDKVAENAEFLRRLGIYGFMRFNDLKDFFCGQRKKPRKPPLINLPDDEVD